MIALGPVSGTRWTVLRIMTAREAGRLAGGRYADCRCECGKTRIVNVRDLRSLASRSCGCLRDEEARAYYAQMRALRERDATVVRHAQAPRRPVQRDPWPVCECHERTECIDGFALARKAQ